MNFTRRALLKTASVAALAARMGPPLRAASIRTALPTGPFPPRTLLTPDLSRSLDQRVLAKPVHARLVIDPMDDIAGWEASAAVKLSHTTERSRTASGAMRVSVLQRDAELIRAGTQPNGSFNGQAVLFEGAPGAAVLTRRFAEPQDWRPFNRISLWCYVHPGNPVNALALEFVCEDAPAGPTDPVAQSYISDLRPGMWNQLTWEIPEYRRDRVVSFTLFQPRWGLPVAGSGPAVTYDFDLLELHRIDAEQVQGWAIAEGKIAYSHIGYRTEGTKIALASPGPEKNFELVDHAGQVAATFPAKPVDNRRGSWRQLDFSGFTRPGNFRLRCGTAESEAFPIGASVWHNVADATLNAYFGLRCGCAVPGVHDACHTDVFCEHEGRRISLAGGWHDAANLSQNANNTHLSIFGLIALADAARAANDLRLAERAEEEARWGLDWSLRLRLAPGVRAAFDPVSFYTDGEVGNADDVVLDPQRAVRDDCFTNVLAALACARSARSLRSRRPALATILERAASEDFAAALAKLDVAGTTPSGMNQGSSADQIAYGALAAVELFRLTGSADHRATAVRLGRAVLETQEQRFVDGIPLTGYLYDDTHRTRITHEFHSSFVEARMLALEALCDAFPDHADWIEWYGGLLLYSEYYCRKGTEASAPFDVLAAAVWRRADLDSERSVDRMGAVLAAKPNGLFPTAPTDELTAKQMRQQFEDAADLGGDYRLRVFPLWYDHIRHGGTVVQLAKAIGLAAAARARGRPELSDLAERQLQWVVGANPFSRSLMYGVGKDWWQNLTIELPNLVGGLAVGINSYSGDAPAWGNNAIFPYKEMWVLASSRAALLLARLIEPAPAPAAGLGASMTADEGGTLELRIPGAGDPRIVTVRSFNLRGPMQVHVPPEGADARFDLVSPERPWAILLATEGVEQELFGTLHPLRPIS
jgi:hypothetical protein